MSRRHPQQPTPSNAPAVAGQRQSPAQVSVSASLTAFQGPLPPPAVLEAYSQVVPNGAERIIAMAESQQQHRQALESAVVLGNVRAQSKGQNFAFALGAFAIIGGVVLIALDKDVQGLVAIISALVALTGVFLYGRHAQSKERQQKRDELAKAK